MWTQTGSSQTLMWCKYSEPELYPGGHEQQLGLHVWSESASQKLPGGPSCQQLEDTCNTHFPFQVGWSADTSTGEVYTAVLRTVGGVVYQ